MLNIEKDQLNLHYKFGNYPKEPGERIHADFLELNKKIFIVILYEFSQVIQMTSTTSLNTINVMREYFARYGICKTLVTNNGPQ